ncbi:hypothetical protein [Lysobacter humi (ex Lee et al. 2017)]
MNLHRIARLAFVVLVAGCASTPPAAPQDAFFRQLASLCGKAFEGRVEVDTPAPTGADPFAARPLVMHVRECTRESIRIPFHVGEDRSRTWVIARTWQGLRLKHDHRHVDGMSDTLTMYGGDTRDSGTATRQEFPADAESKAMFVAQGRAVSIDNTWAIEHVPGRTLVYELARPGRLFRVRFDLMRPVTPPPAPWGAGD